MLLGCDPVGFGRVPRVAVAPLRRTSPTPQHEDDERDNQHKADAAENFNREKVGLHHTCPK